MPQMGFFLKKKQLLVHEKMAVNGFNASKASDIFFSGLAYCIYFEDGKETLPMIIGLFVLEKK